MRRWFRIHTLKIYQAVFYIFCFITLCIVGKGFFSVFEDQIKESVSVWTVSVAEKICYHIYKEESAVFSVTENTLNSYAYQIEQLEVKNKEDIFMDSLFHGVEDSFWRNSGTTPVHLSEDESTDEKLHALEELAVLENSKAADVKEEGTLIVEKMEGAIPKRIGPEKDDLNQNGVFEVGEGDSFEEAVAVVSLKNLLRTEYSLDKMKNLNYLLANFYIVDSSTKATASLFQAEKLLSKNMTMEKNVSPDEPQILIYHTHASETYADSRSGVEADTVVGPGEYLAELLEKKGYVVYHDKTAYDKKNGMDNRNYAYSTARPVIEKYLAEHPSIKVIIDLHRDSGAKRVTMLNGKPTAQLMFFNGLCRNENGPITDLENPHILDNLAFSLQTNLVGRSMYPGLMYKIYLKNYRYNQHLAERYLLIELGTQHNTVQEAYNAMGPLANVLDQVLTNQ